MKLKNFIAVGLALAPAAAFAGPALNGAGATFPAPLYQRWFQDYARTSGSRVNYQSVGSGAGVRQFIAGTVDFAASDEPIKPAEAAKVKRGVVQIPMIGGTIAVAYNNPSCTLKLTQKQTVDIFAGRIKDYKQVGCASGPIKVVHRADASGTTFAFTNSLEAFGGWTSGVGKSINWPTGVASKGNEGVSANAQRLQGAIAYVEYAYAKKNKLAHVQLQNKDGKWVQPDDETFRAAAANAEWATTNGLYNILIDQKGQNAWPITGASYIIMHKVQADPTAGRAVLKFFNWSFSNGEKMATDLDYVPLPKEVVNKVKAGWSKFSLGEIK